MKIEQRVWSGGKGWQFERENASATGAQLVLVFGEREAMENPDRCEELKSFYPNAHIVFGSAAGEIVETFVSDDQLIATAVFLENGTVDAVDAAVGAGFDSYEAGKALSKRLEPKGLRHIFVVSDGLQVNGSELARGLIETAPAGVAVTGGLAGDGASFGKTVVGLNETPSSGKIVVAGFYGENLQIGYGSQGGWDEFGPERKITRSEANVLFELDGEPALALYKKYLGDKAAELPASGLLFPLAVTLEGRDEPLVRTILAVNEADQSMTFAGDLPQGATARLMKANFDRLVEGAANAAETTNMNKAELAILVSCVGRKLVLGQRIEDEVEAVSDALGGKAALCGFYSYGEIAPFRQNMQCELHNQTMTITAISEK